MQNLSLEDIIIECVKRTPPIYQKNDEKYKSGKIEKSEHYDDIAKEIRKEKKYKTITGIV